MTYSVQVWKAQVNYTEGGLDPRITYLVIPSTHTHVLLGTHFCQTKEEGSL